MLSKLLSERKTFLYLLAIGNTIAFATWQVMLNNFAVEHAAFTGEEIGILQSLREVPGFLAFTAILVMIFIRQQTFAILALLTLGINLDHGSDFSTYFDGMPVNFRSHAHAQGYMDLNFIIPELIEKVEFQKGPYFADTGDFSLAGSNSMKTYDSLEENFTELTLGSEDEIRLVTASSFQLENGSLLAAFEHHQANGHFDLDQDVRKFNGLLKYTGTIADIPSRITFSAYDSEWISTN